MTTPWLFLVMTLASGVLAGGFASDAPAAYRDGFRDCPACPEMVALPNGLAIGRYEVTFDEWRACVEGGGCNGHRPNDRGWGRGDRPVINVSWDDAMAYAAWLSQTTGRAYRLPTEPEWEYAARAGTTTRYAWGADAGRNNANCDGCGGAWDGRETAPVGSFAPNAFGVHDMHGNVWEWVAACWTGQPNDSARPPGGSCPHRVVRGGGWSDRPGFLAADNRAAYPAGSRNAVTGFRVLRPVGD